MVFVSGYMKASHRLPGHVQLISAVALLALYAPVCNAQGMHVHSNGSAHLHLGAGEHLGNFSSADLSAFSPSSEMAHAHATFVTHRECRACDPWVWLRCFIGVFLVLCLSCVVLWVRTNMWLAFSSSHSVYHVNRLLRLKRRWLRWRRHRQVWWHAPPCTLSLSQPTLHVHLSRIHGRIHGKRQPNPSRHNDCFWRASGEALHCSPLKVRAAVTFWTWWHLPGPPPEWTRPSSPSTAQTLACLVSALHCNLLLDVHSHSTSLLFCGACSSSPPLCLSLRSSHFECVSRPWFCGLPFSCSSACVAPIRSLSGLVGGSPKPLPRRNRVDQFQRELNTQRKLLTQLTRAIQGLVESAGFDPDVVFGRSPVSTKPSSSRPSPKKPQRQSATSPASAPVPPSHGRVAPASSTPSSSPPRPAPPPAQPPKRRWDRARSGTDHPPSSDPMPLAAYWPCTVVAADTLDSKLPLVSELLVWTCDDGVASEMVARSWPSNLKRVSVLHLSEQTRLDTPLRVHVPCRLGPRTTTLPGFLKPLVGDVIRMAVANSKEATGTPSVTTIPRVSVDTCTLAVTCHRRWAPKDDWIAHSSLPAEHIRRWLARHQITPVRIYASKTSGDAIASRVVLPQASLTLALQHSGESGLFLRQLPAPPRCLVWYEPGAGESDERFLARILSDARLHAKGEGVALSVSGKLALRSLNPPRIATVGWKVLPALPLDTSFEAVCHLLTCAGWSDVTLQAFHPLRRRCGRMIVRACPPAASDASVLPSAWVLENTVFGELPDTLRLERLTPRLPNYTPLQSRDPGYQAARPSRVEVPPPISAKVAPPDPEPPEGDVQMSDPAKRTAPDSAAASGKRPRVIPVHETPVLAPLLAKGWRLKATPGDGSCFFASLQSFLRGKSAMELRDKIAAGVISQAAWLQSRAGMPAAEWKTYTGNLRDPTSFAQLPQVLVAAQRCKNPLAILMPGPPASLHIIAKQSPSPASVVCPIVLHSQHYSPLLTPEDALPTLEQFLAQVQLCPQFMTCDSSASTVPSFTGGGPSAPSSPSLWSCASPSSPVTPSLPAPGFSGSGPCTSSVPCSLPTLPPALSGCGPLHFICGFFLALLTSRSFWQWPLFFNYASSCT